MKPLTDSLPKCLIDFNGRTLLDMQIETLRSRGINDISVIKGYMGEKINVPGIRYYTNDRYRHNNILASLFYAEAELNDESVVTYADVYYRGTVLDALIRSVHDISIVVDTDWRKSYIGRSCHPVSEAEKVKISAEGNVSKIGKKIEDMDSVDGEFPGIMKLSKNGCETLRKVFHSSKERSTGKPYHEASAFEKAYITDIIQELVDIGIAVNCVSVSGGCIEIDTIQDYECAKRTLRSI
jgi:choline kinase